jgi:hypothetical protein
MGKSEGTQLHAQPAHDSSAESANYISKMASPEVIVKAFI